MAVQKFYMTAETIRQTNEIGRQRLALLRAVRQQQRADITGNAHRVLQVTEQMLKSKPSDSLLGGL